MCSINNITSTVFVLIIHLCVQDVMKCRGNVSQRFFVILIFARVLSRQSTDNLKTIR